MGERRAVDQSTIPPYLVDTNWIIDALNGVRPALDAISRHLPDGLGVSIVTLGELYDGVIHGKEADSQLAELRTYLAIYDVVGLTDEVMEVFARQRVQLRRRGQLTPDLDLIIAATALVHDQTLMTRNLRHFERIPGLQIYRNGG